MLKVVTVDHEPLAQAAIRRLLARHSDIEIAAECADGDSAIAAIRQHHPDIALLEVDIPGPNGFQVLDAVHSHCTPAVIFVTANDQHAIKAFEAGALDYIIKPVSEGRFESALKRARRLALAEPDSVVQQIKALVNENGRKGPAVQRMAVKSQGRILFLDAHEIRSIEGAGNYLKIHLKGETHLVRETLTTFHTKLDGGQFIRIHRSAIVNWQHIKELRPLSTGECAVITDDGRELTLSRSYRGQLDYLTAVGNGNRAGK